MTDHPTPEENLADEFRTLGKNLADAMRTAWDSSERKRLQQEIMNGLNELGDSLKRETTNFNESPAGQQLKSEAREFGDRLRNGEVQDKLRQELLSALQVANTELAKLIQQWTTPPGEGSPESVSKSNPDQTG